MATRKTESLSEKRRSAKNNAAVEDQNSAAQYHVFYLKQAWADYVRWYRRLYGCDPDPGEVPNEWVLEEDDE